MPGTSSPARPGTGSSDSGIAGETSGRVVAMRRSEVGGRNHPPKLATGEAARKPPCDPWIPARRQTAWGGGNPIFPATIGIATILQGNFLGMVAVIPMLGIHNSRES